SNWGTAANFDHHNMHYWGVWHGPDNFDGFARYVPRFMTEYGFQSFPQAAAMAQQIPREHLSLADSLLLSRQKSYKTNAELIRHLEQHYPMVADYETFAYLSQLNQQLAMETAINAHRADRARCSGTRYWQLNDAWSGATWSTIDYTGAWKAAHYTVRDRYKPVVVLPQLRGDSVSVAVANDLRKTLPLRMTMTGMTFAGDTLAFQEQELEMPANGSLKIDQWPVVRWLGEKARTEAFLRVELHGPDSLVDATNLFFTEPKALALSPANATMQVNQEHGKAVVTIMPETLLKNAWLDAGVPGTWSANYLDLLPHQPARLTFTPALPGPDSLVIRMLTLNDLLNSSGSDQ
ncbi:MAG: glycoside hydrolase family 2 protein, partial [Bacteroidota bacterium]